MQALRGFLSGGQPAKTKDVVVGDDAENGRHTHSSQHSNQPRRHQSDTPDSIAQDLKDSKLEEPRGDTTDSFVKVEGSTALSKNKRPADQDNESDGVAGENNRKKRRSPTASAEGSKNTNASINDLRSDNSESHEVLNQSGVDSEHLEDDSGHPPAEMVKDLETKSITVQQIIQEVKGIYAGLVMVEKKCIEIVSSQAQNPTKLSKEQWQALIALHRTLLNEHHDFFSASHHPVTEGHELRELASRYAMPARMWRHGIHAFLELLRHRLPESIEHMMSFVYLSYSMMALLMETVPDFLETWIECLGDLARYRMAIEEVDLRDREIWSNTARTWYDQAADLSPNTGRIQHHLAVLARPNIVSQQYLYSKALVAAIPFKNAGESILLLFNPLLDTSSASRSRYSKAEFNFVCAGAVLFKRGHSVEYDSYKKQLLAGLEDHMTRSGPRFKVQGPEIAGALFAWLMDFGNPDNGLWSKVFTHQQKLKLEYCRENKTTMDKLPKDFVVQDPAKVDPIRSQYWSKSPIEDIRIPLPALSSEKAFVSSDDISSLAGPALYETISIVASHIGNKNVVPFMHMVLAYLLGYTYVPGASVLIEAFIPWQKVVDFLNTVGTSGVQYENVHSDTFPKSFGGSKRQLPEDFAMRGLMVTTYYYRPDFFKQEDLVDEDERLLEQPSHQAPRVERCLWCAVQLAKLTKNERWISYDEERRTFSVPSYARSLRQLGTI